MDMDINDFRIAVTVTSFVLFVAIVWLACRDRGAADHARIPFEGADDQRPRGAGLPGASARPAGSHAAHEGL